MSLSFWNPVSLILKSWQGSKPEKMAFLRTETLYSDRFENADRVQEPSQPGLNPPLAWFIF